MATSLASTLSTWPVISIDSARGGGDARRGAPPRPPSNRGWKEEMQRFGHTFKLDQHPWGLQCASFPALHQTISAGGIISLLVERSVISQVMAGTAERQNVGKLTKKGR